MANMFLGLAGSAIGLASRTLSSQHQTMLLQHTKTLAEATVLLLYTAQESGGNPKVTIYVFLVKKCAMFIARQLKHTKRPRKQQRLCKKQ